MLITKKTSTFINWVFGFQFVCTLVALSVGEPNQHYTGGNYQYEKLRGGYQGAQQAVMYSINNDNYLMRLLRDMENYEGKEVNYLVNSKIKDANYGMYPTPSSTSTTSPEGQTTPEAETSLSPSPSTPTTPKSSCEIVIGKNGYVASNVAYYQYPSINYKSPGAPVGYPVRQPVIYNRY